MIHTDGLNIIIIMIIIIISIINLRRYVKLLSKNPKTLKCCVQLFFTAHFYIVELLTINILCKKFQEYETYEKFYKLMKVTGIP